jgi:transposase
MIGLLTDQAGFPLMVSAFEGNRAETKTMLPVIEQFMAAHDLPDVTVVADASMISDANMKAIEAAALTIVFAALAIIRWIEARTGWSIRKFVKTARRYREITIQAGQQTITAADPIPDDLRQAVNAINRPG